MVSLKIKIGDLKLNNPVMNASGTFGWAEEFKDFLELKRLGALITKTITLKPHRGNPPPRTCETPAGMLNCIGLENPGIDNFIKEKLPLLKKIGIPIVVSIGYLEAPEELILLARHLNSLKEVSALELNISCPNIKTKAPHQRLVSQDPVLTYKIIKRLRRVTHKPLITKLSPNVTDITEIAQAAKRAGTDAVALINTLTGMSIDIKNRRPRLSLITAGLSGPAIRPIAIRMVWQVYQKVKIPIIGMGGIIDMPSAIEFFLAGATAIAIGTANFINPGVISEIIEGIRGYLKENKMKDIKELIGALQG
ncbi:MAG: dihydroorotate dehydrogenase [Candidatus Omnitrophica bacterium]|nr:dihydroorotate dehydrogenase [Candidatus Omnitrophota bacterium]